MKEIIYEWMGEILFCTFAIVLVTALTVGFVYTVNKELEMVKQGYIQVQDLNTSKLIWVKEKQNEDNRVISERMELDRAIYYMVAYRRCLKENR